MTQPTNPFTARSDAAGPASPETVTADVREELTGAGGTFEVIIDDVAGIGGPEPLPMKVYASRMANLREVFAFAGGLLTGLP